MTYISKQGHQGKGCLYTVGLFLFVCSSADSFSPKSDEMIDILWLRLKLAGEQRKENEKYKKKWQW